MQQGAMLYEGKAKKIFATDDAQLVVVHYKDDATAGNGEKKGSIQDKGIINNTICSTLFNAIAQKGVPTHFVKKLNERDQLCKQVSIVPLEVITRNTIAGSMAKRLAIAEGTKPAAPIMEICYKNDTLGDPLINDDHAIAIGLATREELAQIYSYSKKINEILLNIFNSLNIDLIDFKLEFGKLPNGQIVLADEISPDTCRLWDKTTGEKLDKDRFRRDLGNIEQAYQEVMKRISQL